MSYSIKNFIGQNHNMTVLEQRGPFQVLQYDRDLSVYPNEAATKYYMAAMQSCPKQLIINLNGSNQVKLARGAMQYMLGQVSMVSGVKGAIDYIGKAFKSSVTKDAGVKPIYSGVGIVVTEPTYKHLIIEDVSDWNGMVCDDGMFLACETTVTDKLAVRDNFSSAVAGNEGLFNTRLIGNGFAVLQSPCTRDELIEVWLRDDVMKIDGPMAVAWSDSLTFTVERSAKTLVGSAMSGEGLVNVYRGTGKILMRPV